MKENCFYKLLYTRRAQREARNLLKANRFYSQRNLSQAFRKFRRLPASSRQLLKNERLKRRVASYYNQSLLRKTFQGLKKFASQVSKTKQLENEHQLRRSKIQSFITNLKQTKEPVRKLKNDPPTPTPAHDEGNVSMASLSLYDAPPSYCSEEMSSPEPYPQEPFNRPPETQPIRVNETRKVKNQSSNSMAMSKDANPRKIDQPFKDNKREKLLNQSPIHNGKDKNFSHGLVSSRSPNGNSDLSSINSRPKSAPRGTTTRTKPSSSSSSAQTTTEIPPELRKEKMKSLEDAAKARVQSKKERENEMKRLKELEEEQKYMQEMEALRQQLTARKKFSNTTVKCEKDLLHEKQQLKKAVSFYQLNLLIRCGFAPWYRLVEEKREYWEKSLQYHSNILLRKYWQLLLGYITNIRKERYRLEYRKTSLAVAHYKRRMLSIVMKKWKSYRKILRAKSTAVTHQILSFGRYTRAFRAWKIAFEKKRRKDASRMTAVRFQQNRKLLGACFKRWKEFIKEQALEREIEERVDVTWAKVQNWLT